MINSRKFKLKLKTSKIAYIVFTIIAIYIFTKYVFKNLFPFFDKNILTLVYIIIVVLVLIIMLYFLRINNKFSREEKKIICNELDNKIEKVFTKYGLYITENYIICLGSCINLFKLLVIPIKEIDAIDIHHDSRYHYKKKGKESKQKILGFIFASIKDDIVFGNNDRFVFNIICDKKIYCITTSSTLNRIKTKEIKEMADYICSKHENIDYI